MNSRESSLVAAGGMSGLGTRYPWKTKRVFWSASSCFREAEATWPVFCKQENFNTNFREQAMTWVKEIAQLRSSGLLIRGVPGLNRPPDPALSCKNGKWYGRLGLGPETPRQPLCYHLELTVCPVICSTEFLECLFPVKKLANPIFFAASFLFVVKRTMYIFHHNTERVEVP